MRRRQRPYWWFCSPGCTAFSAPQALNIAKGRGPEAHDRAKRRATKHIEFIVEMHKEQVEDRHHFLHDHLMYATSRQLRCMEGLMSAPTVQFAQGDQCQYGAEAQRGSLKGSSILNPIGFLTNPRVVAEGLSRRCTGANRQCSRPGGGAHASCTGIRAKDAARYPRGLCRAKIKGITAQLRVDNLLEEGCYGAHVPDDDAEVAALPSGPAQGFRGKYRDDLSGQVFKDSLVKGLGPGRPTTSTARVSGSRSPSHPPERGQAVLLLRCAG
jgi:hypothetical protein